MKSSASELGLRGLVAYWGSTVIKKVGVTLRLFLIQYCCEPQYWKSFFLFLFNTE